MAIAYQGLDTRAAGARSLIRDIERTAVGSAGRHGGDGSTAISERIVAFAQMSAQGVQNYLGR